MSDVDDQIARHANRNSRLPGSYVARLERDLANAEAERDAAYEEIMACDLEATKVALADAEARIEAVRSLCEGYHSVSVKAIEQALAGEADDE